MMSCLVFKLLLMASQLGILKYFLGKKLCLMSFMLTNNFPLLCLCELFYYSGKLSLTQVNASNGFIEKLHQQLYLKKLPEFEKVHYSYEKRFHNKPFVSLQNPRDPLL